MLSLFKRDIQYLKGVGPKTAKLFKKIGASSVGALLRICPRAYEDWSERVGIREALERRTKVCLKLRVVTETRDVLLSNGRKLYKSKATDGIEEIDIVFFNNVYTSKQLKLGKEFLVYGKVVNGGRGYEIVNPDVRSSDSEVTLRPIYTQERGVSSWLIEKTMMSAVSQLGEEFQETIPSELREKYGLCTLKFALENVHFPKDRRYLELAQKRLAFEELYFWQMGMAMIRNGSKKSTKIRISGDYSDEFYFMLPFEPTNAQKRVIKESMDEFRRSEVVVSRLLQGDVGSGKTVVAAALIYNFVKNGYQAAFMVPTEVLAFQHYNTITKLFDGLNIKVSVLTGSVKTSERRKIMESISSGEEQLVIGTHALISDKVNFGKLGLVITDEQHRFGVKQRMKLVDKGADPHLLVMSATPIPRTLAMVIYGDLNVSVLDEAPPGRQHIDTFCVGTNKKSRVYEFIKKHLDMGLQGYIVCPAIEEGDSGLVALETYAKELDTGVFKDYPVGILHGKMKPSEKDEIMRKFKDGVYSLLISTTVIEVGIDVGNAVIMVIENAERFGLSQLHQLRGRVGRGTEKSYCVLISDSRSNDSVRRFKAMIKTNDGFCLANEDLDIRGPGEFLGSRQHGIPEIKMSGIMKDVQLINDSKKAVEETMVRYEHTSDTQWENMKFYIENIFGTWINGDVSFSA